MDEQNWKAQMDAVHDVLDTKVNENMAFRVDKAWRQRCSQRFRNTLEGGCGATPAAAPSACTLHERAAWRRCCADGWTSLSAPVTDLVAGLETPLANGSEVRANELRMRDGRCLTEIWPGPSSR